MFNLEIFKFGLAKFELDARVVSVHEIMTLKAQVCMLVEVVFIATTKGKAYIRRQDIVVLPNL